MKKIISVVTVFMILAVLLATQVSAATTIKHYSFEIVEQNGINVATTTITSTGTWQFDETIGAISNDANYSDKTQYKFILNLANNMSGDAGSGRSFIGDFTIASPEYKITSENPWKTTIWKVKDGGVLTLDNTILIDKQGDTIPGGSGITVENGGVLYLINGAAVHGFNYNMDEGTRVSPNSTAASIKVLSGGVLNLDSKAKQEPIYCEAGAVINLSSDNSNIQWKINGENFDGTTYTAESAGIVTVDFEIACTNHDYQLVEQKANNCRNDGKNIYACSVCLAEMEEVVYADPNAHVWNDGVCTICSVECNHNWSEWTMTGPSGYSENQWKDYSGHIRKTCLVCSKLVDVEIPELQLGLLTGKNILMSGDSIISGYSTGIITGFTGATVNKVGVSSATVSTGEGTNRLINQLIKDRTDNPDAVYDVVFLFGGINDARCETPIGQLSENGVYDVDTFIGALEELIDYAKREYPNSEIAYIIPYKTTYAEEKYGGLIDHRDDYTNAIISVCEKWDVPYLDMYNSEMISGVLNGTYQITTTDVAVGFNNLAQYDGLHLNWNGYYFTSVFVSQMAEKLILGEYQFDVVAEEIDATCVSSGSKLVYVFETGELKLLTSPATGIHTYTDDFDCETALICEVCEEILKEALTHITKETVTYENGYDKAGAKIVYCTNIGCTHNVTTSVDALFIYLGCSVSENGQDGFTIAYRVNHDSISTYEKAIGKEINHGIFVALEEKLGTNDIFCKDGSLANGALVAEMPKDTYTILNLKIYGFKSDEQKAERMAFGLYVIEANDEDTSYHFVQQNKPSGDDKYYFTSYNAILASLSQQ